MVHILVAAYACNPKRGSEEAVGWNWVQTIARNHRATVLTAAYHEVDIRAVCDPDANPRFVFVPHRPWHYAPTPGWKRIENSIAKPIMNLAYVSWQREAYRVAQGLLAQERFDLVHQLTYVGFRFPGHLYKLGLPFVWGPIGGLENTAWSLLPAMGRDGALYYAGRNLINSAQRRFLRSPRRAAAAAGPGLIAATSGIARELEQLYGVKSTVVSEVVAPLKGRHVTSLRRNGNEPLRVVWSGLHLPGKALNLLLQALAQIDSETPIRLHILGDGPRKKDWTALADRLGLAERCFWYGQVSRDRALEIMGAAHVLAITSLKDLTSTVLLEGLALGLPAICPDHCGFADVVTPECGIKVSPRSAQSVVEGFQAGLLRLERDEPLRSKMASAALVRARGYSSQALESKLAAVYSRVLYASNGAQSEAI